MLAQRWNQEGRVIILSETTDEPISMIGRMAGVCYGADTTNEEKNYKRGLSCIRSNHGRALEFVQIYLIIDHYSARVLREFGRHVGGLPTYLQASTRYIDYTNFKYITPPSIEKNPEAKKEYEKLMELTSKTAQTLSNLKIPKEDIGMIYPLAMESKEVYRTNLRSLMDMAKVRKCARAYWEYRDLFKEIEDGLSIYSDQWNYLINNEHIFKIKCEILKRCEEEFGCGRYPKEEQNA